MDRIIRVHSKPGDQVLDFFAGSGTTGEAALQLDRRAVLIDSNVAAMRVMAKRLKAFNPEWHGWGPSKTKK